MMGRVTIPLELRNYSDVLQAELGQIAPEQIRQATVSGIVDTGATQLVIPGSVATALGLKKVGEASVRFADNRRENRTIAGGIEIVWQNRKGIFNAVVEPNREDALIGAVVLETLDLIVDCSRQALVPRDPDRIIAEIE
jgi:predicted aspartyl protease